MITAIVIAVLSFFAGGSAAAGFVAGSFYGLSFMVVHGDLWQAVVAGLTSVSFLIGGLAAAIASLPYRRTLEVSLAITCLAVLGLIALLWKGRATPSEIAMELAVVCPGVALATWIGWQLPRRTAAR